MPDGEQQHRFSNTAIVAGIITLATAISVSLHLWSPGLWQRTENISWDWRLRHSREPARADKTIKLIAIDQQSLDFLEEQYSLTWPLPRDIYSYVIEFIKHGGARGIAFDMIFSESSAQAVDADRVFAEAAGGTLPVVTAVGLARYNRFQNEEKLGQFRARQQEVSRDLFFRSVCVPPLAKFKSATLPIPELLERSTALGSVHAIPDKDGVYRRHSPCAMVREISVLSLPFSLYQVAAPVKAVPSGVRQKSLIIVPHGPTGTYPSFSLAQVLQAEADRREGKAPRLDPASFKDAYVILGATAPGLLDLRPTPLEERGSGVEYTAAILDNLLHDSFGKTVSSLAVILIILALTSLVTVLVFFVHRHLLQWSGLFLIVLVFVATTTEAAQYGVWLPFITPLFATVLAAVTSYAAQYQREGKQSRFLKSAFQHYVSGAVIDQIVRNPAKLSLGGTRRELTIFFSDIKGFSSISEAIEPELLSHVLNQYLTLMTDTIQQYGGTVDKYVGDAVVAFWNAPVSIANHTELGVKAAIECQRGLANLNQSIAKQIGRELTTRIGLHTDTVSVGNFGSRSRFNYTMVGDGANLASRLEGVNKVFGTSILCSEQTASRLPAEIIFRPIGAVQVIGRSEPVKLCEPLIFPDDLRFNPANLILFSNALSLFGKGALTEAKEVFSQLTGDPVAEVYIKRIERELRHGYDLNSWSPVWALVDK